MQPTYPSPAPVQPTFNQTPPPAATPNEAPVAWCDPEVLAFRAPTDAMKAAIVGLCVAFSMNTLLGILVGMFSGLIAWAVATAWLRVKSKRADASG